MRPRPALVCAFFVATLTLATATAALGDINGNADGDAVTLTAREARAAAKEAAATPEAERLVEYLYANGCRAGVPPFGPILGPCGPADFELLPDDCDGLTPIEPLWRRTRASASDPWSVWRFVSDWSCPQDDLPAFTAADFRRLPLTPPTLRVQPDTGRVLVNLPVITMTDPTPQLLVTNLLGYIVEVDATPTTYSWDYGDGSPPLVTTSPGQPFPNHDVAHAYSRAGSYRITLTVTYSGRYRMAGTTTWLPVAGTASTTAISPPITAEEAPSRLVAADCTARPVPPGC